MKRFEREAGAQEELGLLGAAGITTPGSRAGALEQAIGKFVTPETAAGGGPGGGGGLPGSIHMTGTLTVKGSVGTLDGEAKTAEP